MKAYHIEVLKINKQYQLTDGFFKFIMKMCGYERLGKIFVTEKPSQATGDSVHGRIGCFQIIVVVCIKIRDRLKSKIEKKGN